MGRPSFKVSPPKVSKTRNWWSDEHDAALHPTTQVHEQERPTLYLPDGTEVVARPVRIGFRKD